MKNYKCASSSVEAFFGQFCINPEYKEKYRFSDMGDQSISSHGILGTSLFRPGKWSPHLRANEILKNLGEEVFNSYFKFCVVRNPYDRMVSAYHFAGGSQNTDFKTFCKIYDKTNGPLDNSQRIWLNGNGKLACDFYIRYENLIEDIKTVLDKLGITEYNMDDLPNHKSNRRLPKLPYQSYYDDETREIVAEKFKREIEQFGYTF
jgi:hypothetical protein